jgi:predicted dehydrogenase
LSDKPATLDLREALELKTVVENNNCLYGLTHTYTGYPLIKEARHLIGSGQLGTIIKVVVEYSQGWLASEADGDSKQAQWRLDPKRAGVSCCMGDIGVHAANLAEYACDDEISDICADLVSTVAGRKLDDDGTVLLRFKSGARGVLMASQVCVGEENRLVLRVYGEKASLEWSQLEPNTLWLKFPDKPTQMIRAGVGNLAPQTLASMRTPAGHPEGYLEAFANIYRGFAEEVRAKQGSAPAESSGDIPSIHQAIRGMAFIENVVAASQSNQKWHAFSLQPHSLQQQPTTENK